MTEAAIFKLTQTAIVLFAITLLFTVLKVYARKTQKKLSIRQSRYLAIRRLLRISSIVLGLILLLFIWDISLRNVWVHITSILAITAIAFFAVWSLAGNLLAGIIIYFTSPFKLDDEIEVMPDEIIGTVLAVNTFYTVVQDSNANYINIPNSLFFQKYIRVRTGTSTSWKEYPETEPVSENED